MEPLREFRRHKCAVDLIAVSGQLAILSSIEQVDFSGGVRVAFLSVEDPEGEFSARMRCSRRHDLSRSGSSRTRGVQVERRLPAPGRSRAQSPTRARFSTPIAAYERDGLPGGDIVARVERMRGGKGKAGDAGLPGQGSGYLHASQPAERTGHRAR